MPQVVGDADPFRVEPGIPRVRGRLRGIEVVGAAGEVVRVVDGIQGGYAAADASTARAVDEALAARRSVVPTSIGVSVKGRAEPGSLGARLMCRVWKRLM